MQAQDRPPGVAYGECWCGCGGKTNLARQTNPDRGWVKGEPFKYLGGHKGRWGKTGVAWHERYEVDENGCWLWTGRVWGNSGYGSFKRNGRIVSAHRAFYELHVGPIPPGMEIDHLCRVPLCVNPRHMEPVTHAENDRRGAATRLTWQQVEEIRHSTDPQYVLARRYGIAHNHVSQILSGKSWVAK